MKKKFIAFLLFLCFIVTTSSLAVKAAAPDTVTKDGTNYKLVTATEDVTDGNYLIANNNDEKNTKAGAAFLGALSGDIYTKVTLDNALVLSITIQNEYKTIKNTSSEKYVACKAVKKMIEQETIDDNALFEITIDSSCNAKVQTKNIVDTKKKQKGVLYYNDGSPRFTTYSSAQAAICLYKEDTAPSDDFSVVFNANGGVFAEGKGEKITKANGETITGTLPVAEDLSSTAYKYTNLVGWKSGDTTYLPGAEYSATETTSFTAVYEAPENITVDQALEIADITGSANTVYDFKMNAQVVSTSLNKNNQTIFVVKDLVSDSTISIYNIDDAPLTYPGDIIKVTGPIVDFNNRTPEFIGGTVELVTAKATSEFVKNETKTSLKVEYVTDETDSVYDVAIRFGGIISEASYRNDAKYGVIISSTEISYTAGELNFASVDDFLLEQMEAGKNIHNLECTPVSVEGGYQFAWVIDNTEGHYNDTLYAVMYMEYNGKLYLCASKSASVVSAANDYVARSEELNLSALDVEILNKIANVK